MAQVQEPPSPIDFRDEVPTITYVLPCGHQVFLRYDLDESEDPGSEEIWCRRCREPKSYLECRKGLPKTNGRAVGAVQISQSYDAAIIRNRVARLLSCEDKLTWELVKLIADIVGCSPRLVWQVEKDMWSYAEWQQ